MTNLSVILLFALVANVSLCLGEHGDFVNEFVIHVNGGEAEAEELISHITKRSAVVRSKLYSDDHGYTLHFSHQAINSRSKRSADWHPFIDEMRTHSLVSRIEQQTEVVRQKRGYKSQNEVEIAKRVIFDKQLELDEPIYYADKRVFKRVDISEPTSELVEKEYIPGEKRSINLNDPHFKDEWYLLNNGQAGGPKGLDINVVPVWQQGFSGKGVTLCILDDGIEHTHDDLKDNYCAEASADFNDENDDDPTPNPENLAENSHGTRCAGEIAAVANNSVCGVGVAFNAKIGGVRILDGPVTDSLEYQALIFKNQLIDIYSASWGPRDNGETMESPGKYCAAGLKDGITKGRGGKGSIFVWASGNGGYNDDDCACDGYVSSPYTLSIGSINNYAESTYFMEWCPSTLAVIYTGGYHKREDAFTSDSLKHPMLKIVTTDTNNRCTLNFQGTSAAAPLAAGVFALVLEANPNLTWRDMQHIVVLTSRIPNTFESGWTVNGAGLHINDRFGFGALDAAQMVQQAQKWSTVGPQHNCTVLSEPLHTEFDHSNVLSTKLEVEGCQKVPESKVDKLEHVQMHVKLSHKKRGDIKLTLISPAGTRSEMLSPRKNDKNDKGIDFTFMTVRCWNENPRGEWTLIVNDTGSTPQGGILHSWSLSLLGTAKTEKTREAEPARDAYLPNKDDLDTMVKQEKKAREYVNIALGDETDTIKQFASVPESETDDKVSQMLQGLTPEERLKLKLMLARKLEEARTYRREQEAKKRKKELFDELIGILEDHRMLDDE